MEEKSEFMSKGEGRVRNQLVCKICLESDDVCTLVNDVTPTFEK